jgi:hypothetical protein
MTVAEQQKKYISVYTQEGTYIQKRIVFIREPRKENMARHDKIDEQMTDLTEGRVLNVLKIFRRVPHKKRRIFEIDT